MGDPELRRPAVAGRFYPGDPTELRRLVERCLAAVDASPRPAAAGIVPHAGLIYSGECAAHVFKRLEIPPVVVLVGPNHYGLASQPFAASLWARGAFETPLGRVAIAEDLAATLQASSRLVRHDPLAHTREHCLEVELPFLQILAPETRIVPILLATDDWAFCRDLANDLAGIASTWSDSVLLLASSDMTHYEPAQSAEKKDRIALAAIERLDGEALLRSCREHGITMCGRAAVAVVLEASRRLGVTTADTVDYRHSGWVTGDDSSVVAYAGVLLHNAGDRHPS
ncbi:MAG: AmmeMemoRadiSam system protein B [Gemmatimonadetes bacterium]|nr:AmmeMemoRadiSam system protein B [Gemmatimonadota bacterium]